MSVIGKSNITFYTHNEESPVNFNLEIDGINYQSRIEEINYTDSLDDSADSMDVLFFDNLEILSDHLDRGDIVSALINNGGGDNLETGRMQIAGRSGNLTNRTFNITCTSMNQVRDSINNRFYKYYNSTTLENLLKDACKVAKLQVRVSDKFKNIKFKRLSIRGIQVKNLIKEYADKYGAIIKIASYSDGVGGIRSFLFFKHRDDFKNQESVWTFYKNNSKDAMYDFEWSEQPLVTSEINFSYVDPLEEKRFKGTSKIDSIGTVNNNTIKTDSEEEAKVIADSVNTQNLLNISFKTSGYWEYRAGNTIDLADDFGNLLKGLYLITKVDHEVTQSTWSCTIDASKL